MKPAKLYTVKMTVDHGNYRHSESATTADPATALAEVLRTPMGIGYGPHQQTIIDAKQLCALLLLKGNHQFGWADYSLTIKEAA